MRMQINLPVTLMEQLAALAREEHRDARQQAEFYVCRAVAAALRQRADATDDTREEHEVDEVSAPVA